MSGMQINISLRLKGGDNLDVDGPTVLAGGCGAGDISDHGQRVVSLAAAFWTKSDRIAIYKFK